MIGHKFLLIKPVKVHGGAGVLFFIVKVSIVVTGLKGVPLTRGIDNRAGKEMTDNPKRMQIGELSRLSGVPRHTIHYYVKKGVIHAPIKAGRTLAYYDSSHLERLRIIRKIKQDFDSPLAFVLSQFEAGHEPAGAAPEEAAGTPGIVANTADENPDRKQRIVEVAIELFSTQGYYKTSVKDIADRAGYSSGTVYLYFKSKRNLLNEVLVDLVRTTVVRLDQTVLKEKDFFVRNSRRIEALQEHHAGFSEILTHLRAEMYTDKKQARESLKQVYYEVTQPFVFEVRAALEKRLIRPVDPDLLTFTLLGICDILLFRQTLDNRYDTQQIISFVFDLLLNGLKFPVEKGAGLQETPPPGPADITALSVEELDWLSQLRAAGHNQAETARRMGKSRQAVTNYLRRHPRLKAVVDREKK